MAVGAIEDSGRDSDKTDGSRELSDIEDVMEPQLALGCGIISGATVGPICC